MSFDTTYDYVKDRLEGLGYQESKQPFDFENASSREFDKSFILTMLEGSSDPDGEKLNTRMYDNQLWQGTLAFSKSSNNDVFKRNEMYRQIETIVKDLDNPANYLSSIDRMMKYQSWEVEETENYYVLRIQFIIQDQYNY